MEHDLGELWRFVRIWLWFGLGFCWYQLAKAWRRFFNA